MEYRARGHIESLTWWLMNGLTWVGAVGIAWNLLKPGGWLSWIIDRIVRDQPTSYYYIAIGVLALLAGKLGLDNIDRRAFYNLLTASFAYAGTFFILALLLPL